MVYREDLDGDVVKAVGWLEAPRPFPQGDVAPGALAALERLVLRSWRPPVTASGWHDCSLCGRGPGDGPLYRVVGGERTLLGAAEIYVPDGAVLYRAPTLILHYVDVHRYLPPAIFLAAARRADPDGEEYQRACRRLAAAAGLIR